jgi:hypothetical protein
MTGDAEYDLIVTETLADPAVLAAADQLRAAARDRRPIDAEQEEALRTVLDALVRTFIAAHKIPPERVPGVLQCAARLFLQGPPGPERLP